MAKMNSLFTRINRIQSDPDLFDYVGGGSPIDKCFMMAYLFTYLKLKTYVEIGVYRGRSLLSVSEAVRSCGGKAYGIDPYLEREAYEEDAPEEIREIVNDFMANVGLEDIYHRLIEKIDFYDLKDNTDIIKRTSADAAKLFEETKIGMLHIDGNHDTRCVRLDLSLYTPLVQDGGLIIIDDINWESVKRAYDEVKHQYLILMETETYTILWNTPKTPSSIEVSLILEQKLRAIVKRIPESQAMHNMAPKDKPNICVSILSYNHEHFIAECLESVMKQKGNFKLQVVIFDDCSTDGTLKALAEYLDKQPKPLNCQVTVITNETNTGMTANVHRAIKECQSFDYAAFVDGDDFWLSSDKLQVHIEHLSSHPECASSFDKILYYREDVNSFKRWEVDTSSELYTAKDLIESYVVGNISCSVYRGSCLRQLQKGWNLLPAGDWLINILMTLQGEIGLINIFMTAYRQHKGSFWATRTDKEKAIETIKLVDNYNSFLDYKFNDSFNHVRKRCSKLSQDRWDLVIVDDVYPHPVSGFRYQEFMSYLKAFNSIKIVTTGESVICLGKDSIGELMKDFNRKFPQYASKVEIAHRDSDYLTNYSCKLFYFVFLGNAYLNIEQVEALQVPFIFTLYPGGAFGLNNSKSDHMLRRVLNSPCFAGVIVTQKATLKYLTDNNLCPKNKIKYIYGVVTPLNKIEGQLPHKKHFGRDKERLDICFVAHKYTPHGSDKGYDVFIAAANEIASRRPNVFFHVVGNFDADVINVSTFKDRITFYGVRNPEWFESFYVDKDIIISPNFPGLIFQGSFDGFPTASCTDAGLHKTAIFCTDPLNLNGNNFINGRDLVLIEHSVDDIVNKIEHYYNRPNDLIRICDNGASRIRSLYNYESQIAPRVEILSKLLTKETQALLRRKIRLAQFKSRFRLRSFLKKSSGYAVIQLFWQTKDSAGFSEACSERKIISFSTEIWEAKFEIQVSNKGLQSLRIDFAEQPGIFRLYSLEMLDDKGETVWRWPSPSKSKDGQQYKAFKATNSHTILISTHTLISIGDDPGIVLEIPDEALARIQEGFKIAMIGSWHAWRKGIISKSAHFASVEGTGAIQQCQSYLRSVKAKLRRLQTVTSRKNIP